MSFLRTAVLAVTRHGQMPLGALARKALANVAAYASGSRALAACDRIGARARCFGRPRIENEGSIEIGDDFALSSALGPALLATGPGARLAIGHGVTINYGTTITATGAIHIGDGAMIGPFCVVSDTDMPRPLANAGEPASSIEIGPGVWLAARVVVRPGARIGAGAVIAAGSVVEGEIPARAVASGSPARVLRVREAVSAVRELAEEARVATA